MKMTAEQIRLSAVGKLNPEFSAGGVGGLQSSIRQAPRQPSCDCVSLSGQAHRTDCTARVSHKDEKELRSTEDRLNKTEKRFLSILRARTAPTYEAIGIQEITLRLGFDLRYTPDFHTVNPTGVITFWEVKGGFEREDAIVKLKTAAAKFPYFRFIKAVWKDGLWTETPIRT